MYSQRTKQLIAQVFLFAFILIKASGLHAFVHLHDSADQANQCALCHFSSKDNSTPLLTWDNAVELLLFNTPLFPVSENHYENLASEKPAVCELFNRPPPFYTVS